MEIMLYIAALIAAVAFAVLVIYAIITMKAAKQTMENVQNSLDGLNTQMKGITDETTQLLTKTNRLADDVQQKSSKLNGVFDGAKGLGETVRDFNNSLKQLSGSISRTANQNPEKAAQAVKWASTLMEFWKKKK
ncbi:DUF948 domain-containing protein [Oceanobacillus manasiensis]|uniref:DUF948 domain-containing protein n=1 Tax=Oceanobacillus manasiensis TaxID=586413 RepID=UPI0005A88223|nr:DUF948 domain-containing protein [Oceanobacillus manasiensis]